MKKVLWAITVFVLFFALVACQTTTSTTTTTTSATTTTTTTTTSTVTTTTSKSDTAPVISGAENVTIERNSVFIPLQGVTATDAEDGDLTSQISYSGNVNPNAVGVYTATYTVMDSDGNVTVKTRTVTVVFIDRVAPLITGLAAKTIYVGEAFAPLAGVSATDTVDGSVAVQVTGTVNIWAPGQYTLTYTASDAAGNTATQTRVITVTYGDFIFGSAVSLDLTDFAIGAQTLISNPISGGEINQTIAPFTYVRVVLKTRASAAGTIQIALSGALKQSLVDLAVDTTQKEFTILFVIDEALLEDTFTLTIGSLVLDQFEFDYEIAEVRDMIAPVLNVPAGDQAFKVNGSLAALETLLRSRVTAVDDIDGNITSQIVLDMSGINIAEVGLYDVIYRVSDAGGNETTYTRQVLIGNLVDAGILTDPNFQNQGDGIWIEKSNDGKATITYSAVEEAMMITVSSLGNWLSAAGAYTKINSSKFEVDQWYMFTFTVKTTINRIMGFRMGLATNQANDWVDDFDGRNNHQYALTGEYQTLQFYFKLHSLTSTSGGNEFLIELNLGNLNYSNVGKDGVTTFKHVAIYKVVTSFEAPTFEVPVGENNPTKFTVGQAMPNFANYVKFYDMSNTPLVPTIDTSAVNMNQAGTYPVVFSATDSHQLTTSHTIQIEVVTVAQADTVGPVVTLLPGIPTTLDQFTNIQVNLADLVSAVDAVDGEITVYPKMVNSGGLNFNVAGVYTVTYTVFDKSGNVTVFSVDVTILDKQAPSISIGNQTINIGDAFDGLTGLSVFDNVDGVIPNSNVTIDGLQAFVENGKAFLKGTFNVTYTVSDAAGNIQTKVIEVVVTDIVWDEDTRMALGTPNEGPTHSQAVYDANEQATVITNIDPNTQPWDHARWVYYFNANSVLEFGKTYKFEITVKATQATDLYFRIGATLWVDPWIDNFTGGMQTISIGTEYVTYSVIFTVDKNMVNGNAKFQFMYGYLPSDATNTIYIKQFDLIKQEQPIVKQVYDLLKLPAEQNDSTVTFENNILTISNIINSGSARMVNYFDWNKALFHLGETYRFTITIKADQAREVEFWIGAALWEEPWLDTFTGGRQKLAITNEYQTYTVTFKMDKATYLANGAKFQFQYGFDGDDPLNTISISHFSVEHVYYKLKAATDYLVVEDFNYADEAAFESAWTNRVSGTNINPSNLMNLEPLNGGLILTLPEAVNNGWFLARKYSSLTALGVTNDYKYLAFYVTNNTNKTQMAIWLYWSGSQNGYTVTLPAIGESGWVVIDVLAKSGKTPSQITDWGFGFDNQSWNVCTGSITVYQVAAFKAAGDAYKVDITLQTNDISTFDAIPDKNVGVVGQVPYLTVAEIKALLPTSVYANNGAINIPVVDWVDMDTFNKDQAGSYTFQAVLGTLPDGVGNPQNLTVTIEVVVSLEPIVVFQNFDSYEDNTAFQAATDNIVGFRVGSGTFIRTNGTLIVDGSNKYIQTNVSSSVGTNGIRISVSKDSYPSNIQYIAIYVKASNTTNMVKFQSFVYNAAGTFNEITSTIISDFSKLGQGTVVYIPVSSLKTDTVQVSLVINANNGASGTLMWDNLLFTEGFLPNDAPVASVSTATLAYISGLTLKAGESLEATLQALLPFIHITDKEDGNIPATLAMIQLGSLNLQSPTMGTYPIVITPIDSAGKTGTAITIELSVVQVLNDFESYADDAAFKAGFSFVGFRISGSSWLPTNGQLVNVAGNNVLQVNYGNSTNGIRFNVTKAQLQALGATYIGIYMKTSVELTGNTIFQAFGYDASFLQINTIGNIQYADEGTYVFIPVSALNDNMVSISLMINCASGNSGVLTLDNIVIK